MDEALGMAKGNGDQGEAPTESRPVSAVPATRPASAAHLSKRASRVPQKRAASPVPPSEVQVDSMRRLLRQVMADQLRSVVMASLVAYEGLWARTPLPTQGLAFYLFSPPSFYDCSDSNPRMKPSFRNPSFALNPQPLSHLSINPFSSYFSNT